MNNTKLYPGDIVNFNFVDGAVNYESNYIITRRYLCKFFDFYNEKYVKFTVVKMININNYDVSCVPLSLLYELHNNIFNATKAINDRYIPFKDNKNNEHKALFVITEKEICMCAMIIWNQQYDISAFEYYEKQ